MSWQFKRKLFAFATEFEYFKEDMKNNQSILFEKSLTIDCYYTQIQLGSLFRDKEKKTIFNLELMAVKMCHI